MIVINNGRGDGNKWWVGCQMECLWCGRVVELEKGDDRHACWIPTCSNDADVVAVVCETCGGTMRADRNDL